MTDVLESELDQSLSKASMKPDGFDSQVRICLDETKP
jgi:hypothetical protein